MTEYKHSPKVILITGPRASGKTTVAKQLAEELGYHHVWLDGVNGEAGKEVGCKTYEMYHYTPERGKVVEKLLRNEIKGVRYKNLVIEGDALRAPYILNSAVNMATNYYGDYALFKAFSLVPDEEKRHQQYMLREIQRLKGYVKKNAGKPVEEHTGDKRVRDFDINVVPDPPGFDKVEESEIIMQWARDNEETRHPGLPEMHADLIYQVANSETYTPFYQTVEVGGKRIIKGIFNSNLSWENIMRLNPDFRGKSVADLGAMHGYFSFKVEELGGRDIIGLELNPSSVDVARAVAKARGSACAFDVCNVETDELPRRDVYLAMNMLHWVKDLNGFLDRLGNAANEIIMEIGDTQIQQVSKALWPRGFRPVSVVESHRPDKMIGQRQIFHFVNQSAEVTIPVPSTGEVIRPEA